MISAKFNLFAWYGRLSFRERKVLHSAIGIVLLLLVDLTVVTPIWDYYISMEDKIASEERILVRNLVNLRRKEAVEAEYQKYSSYTRPMGSDEEETANLLSEVEQLARSNQVVLVDMKPRETKALQFHKEYIAELDSEADMPNLVRFMYNIEGSTQLLKVSSAKLSMKEPKSDIVKARLTVTKTVLLGKF